LIHRGFIPGGYDGAQNVRDEERSVGRKKTLVRQPDPPSKWPRWTGFCGKTAWDFLDLLLVPILVGLLAVGLTAWFNVQQSQRAQAIATQQRQYDAVQEYMDKMTDLILSDREGGLRSSKEGSDLRKLARARTLTVVLALNGERKRIIVTFLYEARLLEAPNPIVDIGGASLEDAHLQRNPYVGVDLQGTYLNDSSDEDQRGASLRKCDLRDAYLRDADLGDADLTRADLARAHLNDSPDKDKVGTVLIRADLSKANLSKAHLGKANLSEANLSEANLRGAKGVANEQLRAATSLEGATMPDGQTLRGDELPNGPTLEEWIKDRENRRENE
jgi:uncharacterized protein YjbI with pentapeptide repeats